jgi:hypothetical protein
MLPHLWDRAEQDGYIVNVVSLICLGLIKSGGSSGCGGTQDQGEIIPERHAVRGMGGRPGLWPALEGGERWTYRQSANRTLGRLVSPVLGRWAETLTASDWAETNDVFYRTTGSLITGAVSSVGRCARRTPVPQKRTMAWLV